MVGCKGSSCDSIRMFVEVMSTLVEAVMMIVTVMVVVTGGKRL